MPEPVVAVDVAALAGALRRQVLDVAETVAATDPARPVPGLSWTSGDVAAHLCVVHEAFAGALRGDDLSAVERLVATEGTLPERLAVTNERALDLYREPSGAALAARFRELGAALCDELDALAGDAGRLCPAPWYGVRLRATTLACLALAETLTHGHDVRRAAGVRRGPDAAAAALAAPTVMSQLLPLLVDARATAGLSAALRLRVRGAGEFDLVLRDGTATSLRAGTTAPDCVVSVAPDAALLIGFGRIGVARALLTGRAWSYGRAPWLALRFGSLFLHP